jgi:hypothetical protein
MTYNVRALVFATALAAPALLCAQGANTNTSRSNTMHNITIVAKCKGPDGAACTDAQVKDLASGLASGKRIYKPLATVRNVSLASSDGTLKCEQNDGKPCTEDQVKALSELAVQMKCSINYNSSKSNTVTEK